MLASAQYIADKDFRVLDTVTRSEHPGDTEKEMIQAVRVNGGNITGCPGIHNEGSMLSAGGLSRSLGTLTKVVWLNQTDAIRIFTMTDCTAIIEKYADRIIKRNLPFPEKDEKKDKNSKPEKNKKKKAAPPTYSEKRAGAIALIALGSLWTVGGLSMAAVLEDFFPYGFAWFTMSIGFIIWGTVIYRKSKLEEKAEKDRKEQMQSIRNPSPAPEPVKKTLLWLVVNRKNRELPYLEADDSIHLYKRHSEGFVHMKMLSGPAVELASVTEEKLADYEKIWLRHGVRTVRIFENEEKCSSHPCGGEEKEYIGSRTERVLMKILQNGNENSNARQKSLYEMEQDNLKMQLGKIPLLVPFRYDNDSSEHIKQDKKIHMTPKACRQLTALLKGEDNQPKDPIPVYYGMSLFRGERMGTIWNNGVVIYYGGMDIVSEMIRNNVTGPDNHEGQVMHPLTADNSRSKVKMVTAFTNMADLKEMYPHNRVALFSFDELARIAKECDGIVINPGRLGISAQLNHNAINNLI